MTGELRRDKDILRTSLLDFKSVSINIKLFALLTSLINFICTLSLPLLLKTFIDTYTDGLNIKLLALIIIVFLIQMISIGLSSYYLSLLGSTLVLNLRKKLWSDLLENKFSYFVQNAPGEIVSRLLSNTTAAVNLIALELPNVIIASLTLTGSLIILLYIDPLIGLLTALVLPFLLLVLIPCGKKVRELAYKHYEYLSNMSGYFFAVIVNIKMVKSFNMQKKESSNGEKYIEDIFKNERETAFNNSFINTVINAITTFSIYIIIGFGFYRVLNQEITMGGLLASIFYLFNITLPISNISNFVISYANFKGIIPSLIDIRDFEKESNENVHEFKPKDKSSEIIFENVKFNYSDNEVLNGINFTLPKSSFTAIVGESGSGKTTILNLLERFYENFQGEILIDGHSITDFDVKHLRDMISYVPQESGLINGTILDNILYGSNRYISMSEVIEYCKKVNALNFILELPESFNTIIGENGRNLSTGQKQRIAIVRALIKKSTILIFDEATSNLDPISESFIKKIIDNDSNGRTKLVIAHKLSLIENADQIIVLDQGTVVAVGTHEELSKKSKKYIELLENSE